MNIRQLAAHDAPFYQPLRLRALREHPEAFGSSLEDEQPLRLEQVARRLEDTSGNSVSFGTWFDGQTRRYRELDSLSSAEDTA
jgi:hypothetical protein